MSLLKENKALLRIMNSKVVLFFALFEIVRKCQVHKELNAYLEINSGSKIPVSFCMWIHIMPPLKVNKAILY